MLRCVQSLRACICVHPLSILGQPYTPVLLWESWASHYTFVILNETQDEHLVQSDLRHISHIANDSEQITLCGLLCGFCAFSVQILAVSECERMLTNNSLLIDLNRTIWLKVRLRCARRATLFYRVEAGFCTLLLRSTKVEPNSTFPTHIQWGNSCARHKWKRQKRWRRSEYAVWSSNTKQILKLDTHDQGQTQTYQGV